MASFSLSPSVDVSEFSFDGIVPSVATTDAALAGVYRWGPVGERSFVDSEPAYKARYGGPTNLNAETWFTGANYLAYGQSFYVSRAANTTAPFATFTAAGSNTTIVMTGANSTNNPVTLGIVEGSVIYSATQSGLEGVAVASSNTSAVTLASNVTITTSAVLSFDNGTAALSAVAADPNVVGHIQRHAVLNRDDYDVKSETFDSGVYWVAKYPGGPGNSLRVSTCDSATAFLANIAFSNDTANVAGTTTVKVGNTGFRVVFTVTDNTSPVSVANTVAAAVLAELSVGDLVEVGNTSIGKQFLKITDVPDVPSANATAAYIDVSTETAYRLSTDFVANTVTRFWEFYNDVNSAPGQSTYVAAVGNSAANDELHVVIVDEGGVFTGVPGEILEVYQNVSRATDAKNADNTSNYYKDVINQASQYIWWASDNANAESANAALVVSSTNNKASNIRMTYGSDGADEATLAFGDLARAWDLFASSEEVDVSLILQGKPRDGVDPSTGAVGFQLANYLKDNIAEARKDCVVFASPPLSTVRNNIGNEALSVVDWRGNIGSSSYIFFDSGYKYQYDKYNDIYRWIPLNGDIAGLAARTDKTNDPWWSFAGYNRGQILNVARLAWNPSTKAQRDILYKNGVNPVVTFINDGTILFGDKTGLTKPGSFDRINVRRLFIVIEKAIAKAAKYSLFEFNDEFTQAAFRNLVNPYLRTIQGKRGIERYLVICDGTNNTADVIRNNQFVGTIVVDPARSINNVKLNFVAIDGTVTFTELPAQF